MKKLFDQEIDVGEVSFDRLHNARMTPTYENELFLEKYAEEIISFKTYYVAKQEEVDQYFKNKEPYFLREVYRKTLKDNFGIYQIYILSYLYDHLKQKYRVEVTKSIKGALKSSTAFLYLEEFNSVIITSECNPEDILNLMSVQGLNVYICVNYRFEDVVAIELNRDESFYILLEQELIKRKEIKKKVKNQIQKIKPRFNEDAYLSLYDEQACLDFYQSLSDEEHRVFTRFYMDVKGRDVLTNLYGQVETLLKWSDYILPVELLLQSFVLIEKYKEENEKLIEEDRERPRNDRGWMTKFRYKIKFLEYKLLVKEAGKRYRDAQRWFETVHQMAKKHAEVEVKEPNKDTLYWQAVIEAKEALQDLWFVSEVLVYGSVAKGEETYRSDIDLAIRFGFDTSKLTTARNDSLFKIVKSQLNSVRVKYEKLIDGFPIPTENFFEDKGLFQVLVLDLQTKTRLKAIEKADFFKHAVTLFKRDRFTFRFNDIAEEIKYSDIDFVVAPTNNEYTFFLTKLEKNEEYHLYQYYCYDAISLNEYRNSRIREINYQEHGCGILKIENREHYYRVSNHSHYLPFMSRGAYESFFSHKDPFERKSLVRKAKKMDEYYYEDEICRYLTYELDEGGIRVVNGTWD